MSLNASIDPDLISLYNYDEFIPAKNNPWMNSDLSLCDIRHQISTQEFKVNRLDDSLRNDNLERKQLVGPELLRVFHTWV